MLFHVGRRFFLVLIVLLLLGLACLLTVRLVLARVVLLSVFFHPTDHCFCDEWFPFSPQLRLHDLILVRCWQCQRQAAPNDPEGQALVGLSAGVELRHHP